MKLRRIRKGFKSTKKKKQFHGKCSRYQSAHCIEMHNRSHSQIQIKRFSPPFVRYKALNTTSQDLLTSLLFLSNRKHFRQKSFSHVNLYKIPGNQCTTIFQTKEKILIEVGPDVAFKVPLVVGKINEIKI